MAEYLVHKPVDLAKVKTKRRQCLSEPGYLEHNYIAMRKYDGVCAVVHINAPGSINILTRTGEEVRSCDHIKAVIDRARFNGPAVLFGELWAPDVPFPEISGMARRFDPAPELLLVPFDMVTAKEYEDGQSSRPFVKRLDALMGTGLRPAAWYSPGTYGNAQSLCDLLVAAGGYDGLVLCDPIGGWVRGNGTGGEKIKVKQKLSFDLEVIGTEQGKGKHADRIGKLVVRFKDGKPLGVGTGLSDADRERSDWVGKIIEVEAMALSSEGLLREPRMKGVRHDKERADY